ncbi:MAG: hypothetical protein AAB821_02315 [Patescibacteria group bacterium]
MDLKTISKSLTLSVLSFFLVTGVLYASSTIGANMVTTGTLSVTGISTLTGAVTAASTLAVTGASTLTGAVTSAGIITGDDVTSVDDVTAGDDLVVSGGALTVTTTNAATSTISVGCVQMYPTSTATAARFSFNTSSATSTIGGAAAAGFVTWNYGTCPF